ncbi:MAG: septum site-determining protein Ssd [Corynebacterium sp.]|nr:septum site-determining protein Ssd [Corynebacterium sp.]
MHNNLAPRTSPRLPIRGGDFILIACADSVVVPEATHAAAATQCEVKTATDPRDIARLAASANAVIVDSHTAAHVAGTGRRQRIFYVEPEPGPIDYEQALSAHAEQAFVLPAQTTQLLEALARPHAQPHSTGTVIGVAGVCGGVGTSVLAAGLARCAAEFTPTLLIDADPTSGGNDLLLGIENIPGARWPDLAESTLSSGAIDVADLRAALPQTADGIAVLSTARSTIADPFVLDNNMVTGLIGALVGDRGLTIVDVGKAPP